MATRKIYNVKSVKEKRYHSLDLGPFSQLVGKPEGKFVGMGYGEPGGGKSVWMLRFADFYASNVGKVLYNSHEEGVRQTLRDRINDFGIQSPRLYFGNGLTYDEMVHKIERNYYRMAIVDSVQYMGFTYDQLRELRERFAKRHFSLMMVSFGSSKGSPSCDKNLLHACDIKLFFKDGKVYSHGRGLAKPVTQVLFNANENQQLSLFK